VYRNKGGWHVPAIWRLWCVAMGRPSALTPAHHHPPLCKKRGWKTELFTPLLWMAGKKKPQWDFFLFF
jgi:hypothetical protein